MALLYAASADAAVYASTYADAYGAGAMQIIMPGAWPNGETISPGKLALLAATADFGISAAADFDFRTARPPVAKDPYVEVNPSSGGRGAPVTVSGGGFPANTTLSVYLAGVVRAFEASAAPPVATALTDGNGNFSTLFYMPGTWSDGNPITTGKIVIFVANSDFSKEASATFNFFTSALNPSIRLQPTAGGAGTPVTVSGGGFPAGVNIGVYLATLDAPVGNGKLNRFAIGTTDNQGRYTMSFVMPGSWPNGSPVTQDKIVVTVATTDFAVMATATFNYYFSGPTPTPTPTATATEIPPVPPTATPGPYARVNPKSGTAGTVVTVNGGGFPPNQTVNAYLAPFGQGGGSGGNYAPYGAGATNNNGDYVLSFVMPGFWPNGLPVPVGKIAVLIATEDFSTQASASFNFQGVEASEGRPTPTLEPPPPTPEPPPPTPEPPTPTPEPPPPTPEPPTPTPEPPTPTPEPPPPTPEPPTPTPVVEPPPPPPPPPESTPSGDAGRPTPGQTP
ncbi:MAG: hypothetical protein IPK16_15875 [Anaerolineales bacterium]|nr:hypothetical protein [Anaerolineales bacterium]